MHYKLTNLLEHIDALALNNPSSCYQDEAGQHSYNELYQKSNQLAAYLQTLNLQTKAPIMIYSDQSFMTVVTMLAAVKAGHAYIPVDVHSPNERVLQIEEIAQPAMILAIQELAFTVQTKVLSPTELQQATFYQATALDSTQSVQGDQNFYIIFTSGTTGVPKGVQISHNNLLSYVNWMLNDFDLPEHVSCLSQAPYSFDLSVMDLYPTLALGGQLKAIGQDITENFAQLFKVLSTLDLQEWVSTPSFVELCLLDKNFQQANYPNLCHFLFCGEELTNSTAKTLLQRFPEARIFNTYGPTEACVAVTAIEITPTIVANYSRLPIGFAKGDTNITAVDEHGTPSCAGELLISGPSVSKGYLNNSAKTQQVFFKQDEQQAYRTGDLGKISADGNIFYRGRTDFQVKLHGYRIELEDIDQNLVSLAPIDQAITVPRYDTNHKVTQLISYVVLNQPLTDPNTALKKLLAANVMDYMIPQRIEVRTSLPKTANGKIDRKTLMAEVNRHA
ncbi:D-alanine--poly(phosphoribitol) ligase subunit DltA [Bombilactobacillus thymidiniphilus]|uniref:D-alanine--D-alanyl carrier protein ligase n=1 Tax=Bombilactobacillus thymidiniphilus TaxID=2923363 RepID=A0ABY4PF09_9LACO|nr:D-alanine--poly(phosphoribitol) ligase subunit DltA [Bombilactobacillus thymidiniphilus]UQS83892.1 D-alanine--poly(phosphoribitol) ligase subunit DltA [Bombilactobacillus thymidiniphilus]